MKKQYRIDKRYPNDNHSKRPEWHVEISRDGGQTWNWDCTFALKREAKEWIKEQEQRDNQK